MAYAAFIAAVVRYQTTPATAISFLVGAGLVAITVIAGHGIITRGKRVPQSILVGVGVFSIFAVFLGVFHLLWALATRPSIERRLTENFAAFEKLRTEIESAPADVGIAPRPLMDLPIQTVKKPRTQVGRVQLVDIAVARNHNGLVETIYFYTVARHGYAYTKDPRFQKCVEGSWAITNNWYVF